MSKITVIQLLNKIANGEEVPRKFKYENTTFIYSDNVGEHFDEKEYNSFNYTFDLTDYDVLNDELEIIEEDKKIEKLDLIDDYTPYMQFRVLANKINEIIDYINKGD